MPEPVLASASGYGWQYACLVWLQQVDSVWWVRVAKALSFIGTEWFYVVVLPVIFWSVNRRIGLRLAYVFLCSMYTNAWLKDFLHLPRPIGLPGIRSDYISSATGYSMPSGHAQAATTFWWWAGRCLRRPWLWGMIVLLLAAIGWSRLYLGLHWPLDVLVGSGLGAGAAFRAWRLASE